MKNFYVVFSLISVLVFVAGLFQPRNIKFEEDTEKEIEKISIYYSVISKTCKKFNLKGGFFTDEYNTTRKGIDNVIFIFRINASLSLEEARQISINIYLDCLNEINKESRLEKFLNPFPIKTCNLCIDLDFCDKNGIFMSYPNMSSVRAYNGSLEYLVKTGIMGFYVEPSFKETLEDGMKLIKTNASKEIHKIYIDSYVPPEEMTNFDKIHNDRESEESLRLSGYRSRGQRINLENK